MNIDKLLKKMLEEQPLSDALDVISLISSVADTTTLLEEIKEYLKKKPFKYNYVIYPGDSTYLFTLIDSEEARLDYLTGYVDNIILNESIDWAILSVDLTFAKIKSIDGFDYRCGDTVFKIDRSKFTNIDDCLILSSVAQHELIFRHPDRGVVVRVEDNCMSLKDLNINIPNKYKRKKIIGVTEAGTPITTMKGVY